MSWSDTTSYLLVAAHGRLRCVQVGRADHELPPLHGRVFAHVRHERPVAVIGHDQVVDDDLGLVLIDEGCKLESARAEVVDVADNGNESCPLEAETQDVPHVGVRVEERDHLCLGGVHRCLGSALGKIRAHLRS